MTCLQRLVITAATLKNGLTEMRDALPDCMRDCDAVPIN